MQAQRIVLILLALMTAGSTFAAAPGSPVLVEFETELGKFTVAVDPAHAPVTSANFLRYVDGKYYDGGQVTRAVRPDNTRRHDVEIQVVQFGVSPDRQKHLFPAIALEPTSVTGLKHVNGALSMARGKPDSATAAFFVCVGDQPELDFGGKRSADGQGFAAFGRVVQGMDVVRKLQAAHTGPTGPFGSETIDPGIRILRADRVN